MSKKVFYIEKYSSQSSSRGVLVRDTFFTGTTNTNGLFFFWYVKSSGRSFDETREIMISGSIIIVILVLLLSGSDVVKKYYSYLKLLLAVRTK